ncbi:MAG: MerR family transcriptional regulator [Candidatus Thiodiazotropha sp.]
MHPEPPIAGALYPIRKVSEITGINPVTLRAWERRYGLIKPSRTPKGHRLYNAGQIALIERILTLVQQGVSIGQVKRILDSDSPISQTASPFLPEGIDPWEHYRQRMHQAISEFDDNALDAAYNDCLSLYPVSLAADRLLRPLMDELTQLDDPLHQGQRGLLLTYLRNKLGARFHHQNVQTRGRRLLGAALPGEAGELELLLFGLAALPRGNHILMLGCIEPDALPEILPHADVAALLLFKDATPLPARGAAKLTALAKQPSVPVFLGGRLTHREREKLRGSGAIPLSETLSEAVSEFEAALSGEPLR